MAQLTDVQNIDWIPTRVLSRSVDFTDHVGKIAICLFTMVTNTLTPSNVLFSAHFDLHNIASLALEDAGCYTEQEEEVMPADEDDSMDQSEQRKVAAAKTTLKQSRPSQPKPQVTVGFKCILCLGNAALKPLTPVDQVALDEFFKDVGTRVTPNELINNVRFFSATNCEIRVDL